LVERWLTGADPGGAGCARPPKIGKNMIFLRKIVIFHMKYLKNVRASLRNWKKYDFFCVNRDFSHEIPQKCSRLPPQLEEIFFFGVKS
jgi:hypothetical protein